VDYPVNIRLDQQYKRTKDQSFITPALQQDLQPLQEQLDSIEEIDLQQMKEFEMLEEGIHQEGDKIDQSNFKIED